MSQVPQPARVRRPELTNGELMSSAGERLRAPLDAMNAQVHTEEPEQVEHRKLFAEENDVALRAFPALVRDTEQTRAGRMGHRAPPWLSGTMHRQLSESNQKAGRSQNGKS